MKPDFATPAVVEESERAINENEQKIAIAEFCGWKRFEPKDEFEARFWLLEKECIQESRIASQLPDYLHDLNAMHEAEKLIVTKEMADTYFKELTTYTHLKGDEMAERKKPTHIFIRS
jgi:hypothetical protein